MAKMARERALQERRAQKQQKKDERKQAAAEARSAKAAGGAPSENELDEASMGADAAPDLELDQHRERGHEGSG